MSNKEKYIKKFKEIYQRKNGVVISDEIALKYFESLISLVKIVYQPIKK
jgi:hypothetical protein